MTDIPPRHTPPVTFPRVLSLSVLLLLILLRFLLSPGIPIHNWSDSTEYAVQASQVDVGNQLRGTWPDGNPLARPSSYPLTLKAFHAVGDDHQIAPWFTRVQSGFSVLTFLLCGLAVLYTFRSLPLRFFLLLWLYLFSMSEFLYPWETAALTESLSVNGFLLFVAALLLLGRQPASFAWWGIPFVLVFIFVLNLRDSLIPVGVLFFPGACIILLRALRRGEIPASRLPRNLVGISVALLLILTSINGGSLSRGGDLQNHNLAHFLAFRVLPHEEYRAKLAGRFEVPESVYALERNMWFEGWWQDEAAVAFIRDYRPKHLRFLLLEPELTLRILGRSNEEILSRVGRPTDGAVANGYAYAAPELADSPGRGLSSVATRLVAAPVVALASLSPDLAFWLPAGLLLVLLLFPDRAGSRPKALPVFLFAVAWSQYALAGLFDGIESYRHALVGTSSLVLFYWSAGILLGVLVMDRYRTGESLRPSPLDSPAQSPQDELPTSQSCPAPATAAGEASEGTQS